MGFSQIWRRINHGDTNWRCNLNTQALALVAQLQKYRKPHQLIVYDRDDHFLSFNRENSEQQIIKWFKSHLE